MTRRRRCLAKLRRGAPAPVAALVLALLAAQPLWGQEPRTRRSQRVRMEKVEVASPDGKVRWAIAPNAERLTFDVTLAGSPVLDPSSIVMTIDDYDLSAGVVFLGVERYEIDETYPWWGARSAAVDRCNGARIALEHDLSFTRYVLEIRAYDDGIAFRHVIPGDVIPGDGGARTPDERTTFVAPSGSKVWHHGLGGHYEDDYEADDAAGVAAGEWAGPPLVFELPGGAGYGAITEANLVDYAGMALESDGRRGWIAGLGHRQPLNYPYELRYGRERARALGKPAAISGPITTPWRVVMAGRDLNALVTSTIVPNLCPPADPARLGGGGTAWIRPGRAVWRYLDGGDRTLEGIKELSRLAGQLGFEYQVVEGFWSRWSDDEIEDLVEYSRQQGVALWFWRHTNRLGAPEERESFFRRLRDLGVAGAKLDFLDHEAKEVIDLYEALLAKSAEHRIMINFHGANKPTGRARTWPHELVREAVRGMESSSLKERARHQTILPFTRYLAGHADYTTLHFGDRRGDSSEAHQIATLVVFASPLLTVAAHPRKILEHPAVEIIKSVPPVWDETIVLPDSAIGKLAVFARRSGDTWFLAALCGPEGRALATPLDFLGAGAYDALIARDGADAAAPVVVEERVVEKTDALAIPMIDGGGFTARFRKR